MFNGFKKIQNVGKVIIVEDVGKVINEASEEWKNIYIIKYQWK
jgi:hypothetical protein